MRETATKAEETEGKDNAASLPARQLKLAALIPDAVQGNDLTFVLQHAEGMSVEIVVDVPESVDVNYDQDIGILHISGDVEALRYVLDQIKLLPEARETLFINIEIVEGQGDAGFTHSYKFILNFQPEIDRHVVQKAVEEGQDAVGWSHQSPRLQDIIQQDRQGEAASLNAEYLGLEHAEQGDDDLRHDATALLKGMLDPLAILDDDRNIMQVLDIKVDARVSLRVDEGGVSGDLLSLIQQALASGATGEVQEVIAPLYQGGARGALSQSEGGQFYYRADGFDYLAEFQQAEDSILLSYTNALGEKLTVAVDVTVTGVNDAPEIVNSPASASATPGEVFQLDIDPQVARDVDTGDQLTFDVEFFDGSQWRAVGGSGWLSFNSDTSRLEGVVPESLESDMLVRVVVKDLSGAETSTPLTIQVGAVDEVLEDSSETAEEVTITVVPGLGIPGKVSGGGGGGGGGGVPTVDMPLIDQNATEHTPFTYQFDASSFADADALTYTATLAGGGALPGWLSFDGTTRTFSGTPGDNDPATLNVRVTAQDPDTNTVSDDFAITVANVNDAPTVNSGIADQLTAQSVLFSFTFSSGTFEDLDIAFGDSLTYTATLVGGGALPAWLAFDGATRTFSGTPPSTQTFDVRVTATDGSAASVTEDFEIDVSGSLGVSNLNQVTTYTEDTVFNPDDMTFSTAQANVTVTLTLATPAAGALTTYTSGAVTSTYNAGTGVWTATGAKADVTTLLEQVHFIPVKNYDQDVSITTQVVAGADTVNGAWTLTATAVNDAPKLVASVDSYVLRTIDTLNFTIADTIFAENDTGDAIASWDAEYWNGTSWVTGMPTGVTYDGTRSFTVDGAVSGEGSYLVRLVATDMGGATGEAEFLIGVGNTYYGTAGADNAILDGTVADEVFIGLAGNDTIDAAGDGDDAAFGGDDNDSISGGNGDDTLHGDAGNDTVNGGSDDDYLYGGSGDDSLSGGAGNDILRGQLGNDTLIGDAGNDFLDGGAGNDALSTSDGDDTLSGGDGDDYLTGGANDSTLQGGDGEDTLESGEGVESMSGGQGADQYWFLNHTVSTTATPDIINDFDFGVDLLIVVGFDNVSYNVTPGAGTNLTYYYSGGNTIVHAADGFGFTLIGEHPLTDDNFSFITNMDTPANNWNFVGTNGVDGVLGLDGNDTIDGNGDNDLLWGGDGDDSIMAGSGNDRIWGGDGNDWIDGELGDNQIYGGAGVDTIYSGSGDSTIYAGGDGDSIVTEGTGNVVYGEGGNDTIDTYQSTNTVYGGDGDDSVYSSGANASIYASYIDLGEGNNRLISGPASSSSYINTIIGGSGDDYLEIYLIHRSSIQTGGGNDTILGSGNGLHGASTTTIYDNTIDGGDGNDLIDLRGFSSNYGSSIVAGTGDDTIRASGSWTISGGTGNDTFIYTSIVSSYSTFLQHNFITDFVRGDDVIDVRQLGFTGIAAGAAAGSVLGYSYSGADTIIEGITVEGLAFYIELTGVNAPLDATDFLFTSAGNIGTAGAEVLAPANAEGVYADGGDDTITAAAGDYDIYAGSGNDVVTLSNGEQVVFGEAGNDIINAAGTSGADLIYGGAGADTITSGSDGGYIYGGADNDSIQGGDGSDRIYTGDGDDEVYGGLGTDYLNADGSGDDTLYGEDGVDYLYSSTSVTNVTMYGGDGGDRIYAQGGNVTAYGGNDNDLFYTVSSNAANNELYGEAGNDTFTLYYGANLVYGGDDDDTFNLSRGSTHTVYGDDGNDTFNTSSIHVSSTIFGGAGDDVINHDQGDITVDGGAGDDSFTADYTQGMLDTASVAGGDDNDSFYVTTGIVTLEGGNGTDFFYLGLGTSQIDGGAGVDTFQFESDRRDLKNEYWDKDDSADHMILNFQDGTDLITFEKYGFDGIVNGAATGSTLGMSYDGGNDWTLITDEYGDFSFKIDGDVTATLDATDFTFDVNIVNGTGGADTIAGAASTSYNLGGGNDVLTGFREGHVFAGAGNDNITSSGSTGERFIYGEDGDDTITGTDVNGSLYEILRGGDGDDVIDGRQGYDWIHGGDGSDTLTGGNTGTSIYRGDTFEYMNVSESQFGNEDLITDFDTTYDAIDLSAIAAITGFGDFDSIAFAAGETLVHDTASGFAIRLTGDYTGSLAADDFVF